MLDVVSTDKGVLIPRLTQTQRDNILEPTIGLLIFQTDNPVGFYYYNGTAWAIVGTTPSEQAAIAANTSKMGITTEQVAAIIANSEKISADGSVTTHNDVSNAGSGQIITAEERTKLSGVEDNATADMTGSEIKDAYEAEDDTNAFDDEAKSKLEGIEANATADQTLTEILTVSTDAGENKITNLATPIADADAATKKYVDDNDDTGTDDQTLTEILTESSDAGTNKITNLGTPTEDADAATKKYVDDNLELPASPTSGTMAYYDGNDWTSLAPGEEGQYLSYCDGKPSWEPCGDEDPTVVEYKVGDYVEENGVGGVVFYILQAGDIGYVEGEQKGFIAALEDESGTHSWGCNDTDLPTVPNTSSDDNLSFGDRVGDGAYNHSRIVVECQEPSAAARIIGARRPPGWYLPSIQELNLMYLNRDLINATAADNGGSDFDDNPGYWSSTEFAADGAKFIAVGIIGAQMKSTEFNLRAIRSFGPATPPVINSTIPADNAEEVSPDDDLVITFETVVAKGEGNILIKKTSDDSVVETIDVTSSAVTVTSNQVTIDLPQLPFETQLYVEIPAGSIKSFDDADFAGITDKTTWNFTTMAPPEVGDSFQGGILAYIFSSSDRGYIEGEVHGLIVASEDLEGAFPWGCEGTLIGVNESDNGEIGSGAENTKLIVESCDDDNFAAKACADYESEGYTDWFLPSDKELEIIMGDGTSYNFSTNLYWTSTESDKDSASAKLYINNAIVGTLLPKSITRSSLWGRDILVRPVRAF